MLNIFLRKISLKLSLGTITRWESITL